MAVDNKIDSSAKQVMTYGRQGAMNSQSSAEKGLGFADLVTDPILDSLQSQKKSENSLTQFQGDEISTRELMKALEEAEVSLALGKGILDKAIETFNVLQQRGMG